MDGTHSAFNTTGTSTVPADGQSAVTLQFTAKDVNDNLVSGQVSKVTFRVLEGDNQPVSGSAVTVDAAVDGAPGIYTAQLHGTKAGSYTVKPLYDGAEVGALSQPVTLTAGSVDSGKSLFELSGDNTVGQDDASRVKLMFTAKDANGNPVTGQKQKVTFKVQDSMQTDAGSAVTVDTTTEEEPGVYTAMLYGTKAGTWTVTPVYDSQPLESLNKDVTLSAGTVDENRSELTLPGESTVVANGTSPVALQFTAKDMYGNPVTGQVVKVAFRVQDSNQADAGEVTIQAITEGSAGVYTASLVGTRAGVYSVIPTYDGQPLNTLGKAVTLTAGDVDGTHSAFNTTGTSTVPADGQSAVTLQFTAKDVNDNLVSGQVSKVTFRVLEGDNQPVSGSAVTVDAAVDGAPGIYTAQLHGTKAGSYTVKPLYDGAEVGALSQEVTLTAGEVSGSTSTFMLPGATTIAADDATTLPLSFAAKDVNSNPVTGGASKVTFSVWDGSQEVTSGVTVDAAVESSTPGTYTAQLHGTKAGSYTVKPLYEGAAVGTLSKPVTLTAGEVSDTESTFDLPGGDTIVANDTATLKLSFAAKDRYGNPVPGVESKMSISVQDSGNLPVTGPAVTVEALTQESPGVYTAQLHGTKAGSYTVKPLYEGATVGTLSQSVTLTAGEVSDTTSTFTLPGDTSIVADDTAPLALSFAAKDVNSNPVTGGASKVTFSVWDGSQEVTAGVTVDTATEESPGVYTAQLHGTKAGSYTVKPLYDGTEVGTLSQPVTLTAGDIFGSTSTFGLPGDDIIVADGSDNLQLSLTAKDVNNNPVTGGTGKLTFVVLDGGGSTVSGSDVTVGAAVESGMPGTYTAQLHGTKAGTFTVKPEYDGVVVDPLEVTVTLEASVKDVEANGYTYTAGAGFPKTGFVGAKFTLNLDGDVPSNYTWTSSAGWAPVTDGVVAFVSKGNAGQVTITATSIADPDTYFTYKFALKSWFDHNGGTKTSWQDSIDYCAAQSKRLPTLLELGGSATIQYRASPRGEAGALWSEWGDMTQYGTGFVAQTYWASNPPDAEPNNRKGINLHNGQVNYGSKDNSLYTACLEDLE
ncbi:hypothetical protein C3710_10240 [Lelliottia aquatilis]|nr:hypothetical protein C3710_10240 [Lelliottia aquatilis]